MPIKLALLQAAQLSRKIQENPGKSVVLHLREVRDQIKGTQLRERDTEKEREEEKSPAHGGIRSHNHSVMRRVLCRCATTAAQG